MVTPSLILQAAQSLSTPHKVIPEDSCFLGFTATKKLGKAHIRNRTKRRLRAAAQQIFPHLALNGIDYSEGALFFVARKHAEEKNLNWFDNSLEFLFEHDGHEFFKCKNE